MQVSVPLLHVCFCFDPDAYMLCSTLSFSTLVVHVVEASVPYVKWLNYKTKGNRKKPQHVKKKQMELQCTSALSLSKMGTDQ